MLFQRWHDVFAATLKWHLTMLYVVWTEGCALFQRWIDASEGCVLF